MIAARSARCIGGTRATGPAAPRILQVHPTRRCNLRCAHCYSSSAPDLREELPLDLLTAAVADARAEGYTVVSLSGGEPLLYRSLVPLLEAAKARGCTTTLTSSGILLTERRLHSLVGALDLLAISLDGVPSSHDRMRASDGAFARMASRLAGVRAAGIPFGFIFTLTQHNVHELAWVARFARDEGARLLQIHPLELVGRAADGLPDAHPDEAEIAQAWLAAVQLQAAVGDGLRVQLDLADRRYLLAHPSRVVAPDDPGTAPLSSFVSPLVVEADGRVVPLTYGFPAEGGLRSLRDEPLHRLAARWRVERLPGFLDHCRAVLGRLEEPAEFPFVNWYEEVGDSRPGPAVPVPS